jgi:hypothetical protein
MLTPKQVIDEYYLEVRCKLLEVAAILDRYDRAADRTGETPPVDPRWERCRKSLELLNQPQKQPNRAEQTALIFSDKP